MASFFVLIRFSFLLMMMHGRFLFMVFEVDVGRAVQHFAFVGKTASVAGAVPALFVIVPFYGAAYVRAFCGDEVEVVILIAVCSV